MLKGLEATEVKFSELERTLRFDAEFFHKVHLASQKKLLSRNYEVLGGKNGLAIISDGNHFSISDSFRTEGIPYYRGQDVTGHFFVEQATPTFISEEIFNEPYLRRSHLKKGDVLLSIVGTIGEASLVTTEADATCSCKLAILRSRQVKPEYLATFLKTQYGRSQIERFTRGAVQMGLLLEDLDQIVIARFSDVFEDSVKQQVEAAFNQHNGSDDLYKAAEARLLQALKLDNWQPPRENTYEVRSKTAFAAGRLDADHFAPKYDALLRHLQKHAKRCRFVHEFATFCDRGTQPEYSEDGPLAVVNSKHILETGLDYDNFERADAALWERPDFLSSHIQRGDILTYTTGAKIGRTAAYLEDEAALASNHVNLLRAKEENAIYVALALNSLIGRMQTRRACTGSAQVELYPSDIKGFVVPFVDEATQNQIVADVEAAHAARRTAKQLLEAAKRAVEAAIETDEAAGLKILANVK